MLLAENECLKCKHRWQDRPYGFCTYPECPNCGSLYWKWLNYEAFKLKNY